MSDHGVINVLIVGESWISAATHYKGWDQFSSTTYESGVEPLRAALSAAGIGIVWMPSHEAARDFPDHVDGLAQYDAIVLSDIGANTLLLHPDTWLRGQTRPNRLTVIRDWVSAGGGLAMAGGYLSFQGINASARYRGTPVEEVLPVRISPWDDRMEIPEGAFASIDRPDHPIVAGIDGPWPPLLGMNELEPTPDAEVIASWAGRPLLAVRHAGRGRTLAWASDIGPHWCPESFVQWPGYARLWSQAIEWLCGRR